MFDMEEIDKDKAVEAEVVPSVPPLEEKHLKLKADGTLDKRSLPRASRKGIKYKPYKRREPTEKQNKYVAARLEGKNKAESLKAAGYHPAMDVSKIEKPGSLVWEKIRGALEAHGMNDDWLAKQLKDSVDRCDTAITRFNNKTGEEVKDPDLAAKDRLLGKIAKLKGYEREHTPQVAVQINNNTTNNTQLTDRETESIINAIRAEIGARESADVLEGSIGDEDPASCNDMGKSGTEQP